MASVSVQIVGLEKLQAGVARGPAVLAREVRTAMEAGSLLIEGTARSLAPKDTDRLAGSITHVIGGGGVSLQSRIGPSVSWGIYVEQGRRPGKQPPIAAIEGWARRHGVNPYVLARSIGRKGTRKHPFMEPAFTQNSGRVIALFEALGAKVVSTMSGA